MTPPSSPRKAGVIGWPIGHSRSPLIHGHWIATYGLEASYEPIALDPKDAPAWFKRFHHQGLIGANVTIPHKETALAACDHLEPHAERLGSVNTLWVEGKTLCGTSTDGQGFMANLADHAPTWREHPNARQALVLGAGGAARAIVDALLVDGIEHIILLNRTAERADQLAHHFGQHFGKDRITAGPFDQFENNARSCGLLVNTTALGMSGQPALNVPVASLADGATIADIVYAPLETDLLKQGREREHPVVEGLGMLLHQAVPGFHHWFGVKPTVTSDLRQIVVDDLQTKS
ncbi:MAG: shikimate dehydrogenase [Pseudomonadota bacterium]